MKWWKNKIPKIVQLLVVFALIALCLFSSGCTDTNRTQIGENVDNVSTPSESTAVSGDNTKTIVFGMPNWPGVTVKTHVVKNLLEEQGYDVEIMTLSDPGLIYASMAENNGVDVLLGGWLPSTQKPYWDKYHDELELVNINLNSTWLGLGVPDYVYDQGIHSIADLKGNASQFDGKILTLEAGNGMTIASEESIDEYGLDGFEVLISSTPAMLAEVTRAKNHNNPVVFCAWEPHYMMEDYNVRKLKDPKKLFGDNDDVVYTVARKGFATEYPRVYNFLKNFQISVADQNGWIEAYGREERDPDEVAKEWIAHNQDLVKSWGL